MRKTLIILLVALLAALAAVGPFMPTASQAASAQRHARQESLTGTLVAAPQATRPTTLLLQVGSQTLAVSITGSTRVIDRASHALSLTALHDGDTLRVDGAPSAAGAIVATAIVDLTTPVSVPPPPAVLQVTGVLATAPAPGVLCLTGARVTAGATQPRVTTTSLCAVGQLPLYYTSGTRFLGPAGQAISESQLRGGDKLRATGSVISARFTATVVQDLTRPVSTPPPVAIQVTGVLATAPAPGVLCLTGARVTAGAARPQVATASPCAVGQLPLYYTGGTRFRGPANQAISESQLRGGDKLHATGVVASGRFTASVVQDLTRPVSAPPPPVALQVTGVLATAPAPGVLCLTGARVTAGATQPRVTTTSPCAAGQLPLYYTSGTRFRGPANQAISESQLRGGDKLHATGVVASGRFTASVVQDLTRPVSAPPPPTVTAQGVLVTAPGRAAPPLILCLRDTRITSSSARRPQVATASPCPVGQLPVYVLSSTRVVARNGAALRLYQLRAGQTLRVAGAIANGRLTASAIDDLSIA